MISWYGIYNLKLFVLHSCEIAHPVLKRVWELCDQPRCTTDSSDKVIPKQQRWQHLGCLQRGQMVERLCQEARLIQVLLYSNP